MHEGEGNLLACQVMISHLLHPHICMRVYTNIQYVTGFAKRGLPNSMNVKDHNFITIQRTKLKISGH